MKNSYDKVDVNSHNTLPHIHSFASVTPTKISYPTVQTFIWLNIDVESPNKIYDLYTHGLRECSWVIDFPERKCICMCVCMPEYFYIPDQNN